ncbi:MAG: TetR/AcrR family transcriptional regulator [Candidatus Marinimicrobia bacterium]|nr:TetR/AcrR family transcriptional regulator [Candidatus Neomarinimicrobiota bacterium]
MKTGRRKPSSERQEEIVLAVLHLIGERGASSLTATAIAAEIGVTSGALFRHYNSLDEIYRAVLHYAQTTIETTFPDPALPPVERLFTFARNRVQLLGASPGLAWLMRSEQADDIFPSDAVAELWDVTRRSTEFILQALHEGVKAGVIRNDIDSEVLLILIMGTMHALIGLPGIRRLAKGQQANLPDRVLLALEQLLQGSH